MISSIELLEKKLDNYKFSHTQEEYINMIKRLHKSYLKNAECMKQEEELASSQTFKFVFGSSVISSTDMVKYLEDEYYNLTGKFLKREAVKVEKPQQKTGTNNAKENFLKLLEALSN